MEKGRILFTDLDGTLLSDDNQISKKNHGAIEDTLKKGSFVAAATGRPLESAKAVVKPAHCSYAFGPNFGTFNN